MSSAKEGPATVAADPAVVEAVLVVGLVAADGAGVLLEGLALDGQNWHALTSHDCGTCHLKSKQKFC